MAVYNFSALTDGQAISFNPGADLLNFDQTVISAADIRVVAEGTGVRISVVSGSLAGKDILLQNTTPQQLATSNTMFANASALLFGDNSASTAGDDLANTLNGTAGNDLLQGFGGADTMNGGAGNDTYIVSTGDVISDTGGVDTVISDVTWTLGADFENLTLTNNATRTDAIGNNLSNVITGSDAANFINGKAGDDTIFGMGGNDSIDMSTGGTGFVGNRYIDGGAGIDTVDYDGYAQSAIVANLTSGAVTGGGLNNTGSATLVSIERLVTGSFNDKITGSGADNYLDGRLGNDTIDGGAGNDTVLGGGGDDVIAVSLGADSLTGGAGADAFLLNSPNEGGIDVITDFTPGTDKLRVESSVYPVGTGDFVAGDPRFFAAPGASNGHDADDRIIYNTTTGDVFYDSDGSGPNAPSQIVRLQGAPALTATDIAVDNNGPAGVFFQGTSANETFFGGPGNDTILGGAGIDSLDGQGGNDFIDGGADGDFITGGDGADTLLGGDGDDTIEIFGSVAGDHIDGGAGTDFINMLSAEGPMVVDLGAGTLTLPSGTATLVSIEGVGGSDFADQLTASDTGSTLSGRAGHDTLTGAAGNDTLIAGNDGATLVGNGGDDSIRGGDGADTVDGGAGNDNIDGGFGNDSVAGGAGNDTITDRGGNDTIDGGADNDTINAGAGDDSVAGGAGDDTLFGAEGVDTLTGGLGVDRFVPDSDARDFISDFTSGTDKLQIDGTLFFNVGASGNYTAGDARFFSGAGATSGHDADDRVIFDTTTGNVWYDADGNGATASRLIATLQPGAQLVATDVTVVNGSGAVTTIQGTDGNDTLSDTAGDDFIDAKAGFDFITSTNGSDTILGGADNDFIQVDLSRYGNDSIDGGTGFDDLALFNGLTGIVVDMRAGTITGGHDDGTGSATFVNIEAVNGTAFNDRLIGNDSGVILEGGGGNDTVTGGAGNDSLVGDGGNDSLAGGAGNDTLGDTHDESIDADTMDGGLGDDLYIVQASTQTLVDAGGVDTIEVQGMSWTLGAGFENLTFYNLANDNGFRGFSGTGNELNNTIDAHQGLDGVVARGLGGNDSIVGTFYTDTLDGGAGNDTLVGLNASPFRGSTAPAFDTYAFSAAPGAANADLVVDFSPSIDKIQLDGTFHANIGASGNFIADDGRFFAGAGATSGHDATDRVIYDTTTGNLWYDADGNGAGAAQLVATLQGAPAISAADITVINGTSTTSPTTDGSTVTGTAGNDSIIGTVGNDTIDGGAGDDTINGSSGNDSLVGGVGNDSIFGAEGVDTMVGGDGNDTLNGDNAPFGANTDADVETYDGGLGDDLFIVDNAADVLADAGGVDTVRAVFVNWTLGAGFENLQMFNAEAETSRTGIGNELANLMDASAGGWGVLMDGRGGNDTLLGSSFGVDTLLGGDGNDSVDGGENRDSIDGGAGNDTVLGGAGIGEDTLTGGAGNDVLTGGGDIDQFVFAVAPGAANADIITDFASGVDKIRLDGTVHADIGASGDFIANDARFFAAAGASSGHDATDRVIFDTSTGKLWYDADGNGAGVAQLIAALQTGATLTATDIAVNNGTSTTPPSTDGTATTGTAGNDSLTGTAGNDTISGLAGNDTIDGAAGNDSLLGGDGTDSILGGDGNDTLDGGAGADTMAGGLGNDTYIVDNTLDVLSDTGGIDTVVSSVSWNLGADFENITLTGTTRTDVQGNNLNNVVTGSDAANFINARAGDDTIFGMGGNDSIDMSTGGTGFVGNRVIDGGAGVDTVDYGGYAKSAVFANLGTGVVTGGGLNGTGSATITNVERLVTDAFNDSLTGSSADNYLNAAGGNDTLNGGLGADTLIGGLGNDSFVFSTAPGASNVDLVNDFVSGTDRLVFDHATFTAAGAAGNFAAGDARFFAAAGATAGHDADDRLIYDTTTGALYYDADGSGAGAAQQVATVAGHPAIAATDLTVV